MKSIKLASLLLLIVGVAVTAQEGKRVQSIVQPYITEHVISFESDLTQDSFTLRISGSDGVYFTKTFGSADELYIDPLDHNGYELGDGLYFYEITANPVVSDEMKVLMKEARETGDYSNIILPEPHAPFSGSFRIQQGTFVLPYGDEPRDTGNREPLLGKADTFDGRNPGDSAGTPTPTPEDDSPIDILNNGSDQDEPSRDQMFQDDIIVVGSICVGFDCANGENFNFDTIRMKENNVRIAAIDTSRTSSFPSVDWELTFNDSANGGENYFMIQDISSGKKPFKVMSGASDNSILIRNNGFVGFGTNAPLMNLHTKSGNSPALRLEQDGTQGFAQQIWDIGGNESNFFVRNVTNGSEIPFKVAPGARNNLLVLSQNNKIGINDSTPDKLLHLSDYPQATLRLESFNTTKWDINGGATAFTIGQDDTTIPMTLTKGAPNNTFFVDASGQIGLGDSTPDAALDLESGNLMVTNGNITASGTITSTAGDLLINAGDAKIISNTANTGSHTGTLHLEQTERSDTSFMMVLRNEGQATFSLEDTFRHAYWNFGTNKSSEFIISKQGSGTFELSLAGGGNMDIAGTLTQGSDANRKENFGDVDPMEILNKVLNLPISTWNYKHDDDNVRHLGPMAQDFYSAFGLGHTSRGISVIDQNGVTLGAIQGLNQLVEEKDAEIKQLKDQLSDLEARFKKMEALLLD